MEIEISTDLEWSWRGGGEFALKKSEKNHTSETIEVHFVLIH